MEYDLVERLKVVVVETKMSKWKAWTSSGRNCFATQIIKTKKMLIVTHRSRANMGHVCDRGLSPVARSWPSARLLSVGPFYRLLDSQRAMKTIGIYGGCLVVLKLAQLLNAMKMQPLEIMLPGGWKNQMGLSSIVLFRRSGQLLDGCPMHAKASGSRGEAFVVRRRLAYRGLPASWGSQIDDYRCIGSTNCLL